MNELKVSLNPVEVEEIKRELEKLNPSNYDNSIVLVQHGCPGQCTFCLVGKQKPVYRNIEDVISEIEIISRYNNSGKLVLIAPVFLYDLSWVRKFCRQIIEKEISIIWETDIRADFNHTNENFDTLQLMRRAGCKILYIGAETYDPQTMKRIKKKYKIEDVIYTSKILMEMGFDVVHQLLIGLPGDSDDSYMTTYEIMKNFPLYINHNIQILRPHPGTDVRKQAEKDGLLPQDFDDYQLLQSYVDKAVMGTGPLTRRQVTSWYKAFKYLYYHRRITRRIKSGNLNPLVDFPKLMLAGGLTWFHLKMRKFR
ncbi:radical SAM protein [bacterium]|nr:radical SAM protein [bacterium]